MREAVPPGYMHRACFFLHVSPFYLINMVRLIFWLQVFMKRTWILPPTLVPLLLLLPLLITYNFTLFWVRNVVSHSGKNIDWWCLIAECWGEYLGQEKRNKQKYGENCLMKTFIIRAIHVMLLTWLNRGGDIIWCTSNWEMHTIFSSGNIKGRSHVVDLGVDRTIIWKLIFDEYVARVETGWSSLKTASDDGVF
jgi:hypothetical protein